MAEPYHTNPELRADLTLLFTKIAVGRGKALHLQRIHQDPRFRGYTEREIRGAISELIRIDGVPIHSDSTVGHYRVTERDDISQGVRTLRRRALAELYRAKRLADCGRHELGGQMDLDLMTAAAEIDAAMRVLDHD